MTDQEHEQHFEDTSEGREETMKDLDVPEEDSKDIKGGLTVRKAGKEQQE